MTVPTALRNLISFSFPPGAVKISAMLILG